mmetsp:Transcript_22270/g.39650  ORF Transcript_22270/g.39650 Transcript_22270/m.39650 type:complete len:204 (+) Transcript_22270:4694-5305(+)
MDRLELLLAQVHVACKLSNDDAQGPQTLPKFLRHLCDQCFHRRHVNHLEILAEAACSVHVLADQPKDAKHRNVRLTSACGSTNQQVLRSSKSRIEHDRLDCIQLLCALECNLRPLRKFRGVDVLHVGFEGIERWSCWNVNTLIAFAHLPFGALRKNESQTHARKLRLINVWMTRACRYFRCHRYRHFQVQIALWVIWVCTNAG